MGNLFTKVVDPILGKPFRLRGRGDAVFDCLGVVIYLYREVYGIILEDPFECESITRGVSVFRNQFERLESVEEAAAGDLIHLYNERKISDQHLAIIESPKWIVVATPTTGVCRAKIQDFAWYDHVDAYRYVFDH